MRSTKSDLLPVATQGLRPLTADEIDLVAGGSGFLSVTVNGNTLSAHPILPGSITLNSVPPGTATATATANWTSNTATATTSSSVYGSGSTSATAVAKT